LQAWNKINKEFLEVQDEEEPLPLSVIVPTYNCAHSIRWTLESLERQSYPALELVVVDAGSTDGTLDLISRSYEGRCRIYSVAQYHLAEMYNRGVSLSSAEVVGFLLPGDSYVSARTLHFVSREWKKSLPHMLYGGCLLRSGRRDPRVLLEPLSESYMRRGRQPASLQACWFEKGTLRRLGKFDARYLWRSPYDLLCRMGCEKVEMVKRVLVDHQRRRFSTKMVVRRVWETQDIIRRYFGRWARLRWWLAARPLRFVRMWWHSRARD
jgi:glycosyltransferase involved in cell wall biosynthesis